MVEKRRKPNAEIENDNIDRYLLSPGALRDTQEISMAMQQVPLTLQPFFKDQIDLNSELVRRFPNMPLMSVFRQRELYSNGERQVATLTAQDGAASLIVDISKATYEIQFSFMYGSMLALRFHLDELSDLDRRTWLDNMQTRFDETVFLWGQSRWEKDYIICVPHSYYISILAFSPNHFEAAVRMTPTASDKLFSWMREFWYPDTVNPNNTDSQNSRPTDILSNW